MENGVSTHPKYFLLVGIRVSSFTGLLLKDESEMKWFNGLELVLAARPEKTVVRLKYDLRYRNATLRVQSINPNVSFTAQLRPYQNVLSSFPS